MTALSDLGWLGLTGSGAYDAGACPARMALPQLDSVSERADRGTELHTFCRATTLAPSRREEFENAVSEEYRHTAKGMNLDLALDGLRVDGCEVAFALNAKTKTCRMIGANIDRKYNETLVANGELPLGKYDVAFTVDVLAWSLAMDCPVELDYKSGASIGEVEEHGQRKISSAGLMLYYGSDTAISRVAYIKDNGDIWPDGAEFSLLDAWQVCDELVEIADRVERAKAIVAEGKMPNVTADREKQCKYCRAFSVCPYWTGLARGTLGKLSEVPKLADLEKMNAEELGKLFDKTKDILKVFGKLEDDLWEFAAKSPLPVDDAKEYRAVERNGKEFFDNAAARGLLITTMSRLGMSEEEIAEKMKGLNKKGAPYIEVRKQKRVSLPMLKKAS